MKRSLRRGHSHGFTLLEILVVVALIGVMVTLVVTSVGDGGRQQHMENEARRLVAVVKLARDEAVLMSEELSIVFRNHEYEFQRLGEKQWAPLDDDRILTRHAMPAGLAMELALEAFVHPPQLKSSAEAEGGADVDEQAEFRVYLLSSGEVQPFTLYIKDDDVLDGVRFRVTADEEGEVTWQGPLDATVR
ncbi:MAG: type II secretion system minor pseudopilin GspH [Gammaproteobacteria bacterium]